MEGGGVEGGGGGGRGRMKNGGWGWSVKGWRVEVEGKEGG